MDLSFEFRPVWKMGSVEGFKTGAGLDVRRFKDAARLPIEKIVGGQASSPAPPRYSS